MIADPYGTLGVSPTASDAEIRTAYRRLVQRHHPDHNAGSAASTRRFEAVQEAYAQIRERRRAGVRGSASGGAASGATGAAGARAGAGADGSARGAGAGGPPPDPDLDARLARMEQELNAAQSARERAARDARRAAAEAAGASAGRAGARPGRATDEELGYVTTDDSFSKILDDAAEELWDRWGEARRSPAAHRISDLIDDLAAKLTGDGR